MRWTIRSEVVAGGKDKARTRSHEFLISESNAMKNGGGVGGLEIERGHCQVASELASGDQV